MKKKYNWRTFLEFAGAVVLSLSIAALFLSGWQLTKNNGEGQGNTIEEVKQYKEDTTFPNSAL